MIRSGPAAGALFVLGIFALCAALVSSHIMSAVPRFHRPTKSGLPAAGMSIARQLHGYRLSLAAFVIFLAAAALFSGPYGFGGPDSALSASASDLTVVSATTAAPGSATAGVSFTVSVDATVDNLGPADPTVGEVTEVLSMPADCTAVGGPSVTVTGLSLTLSTDVVVPTQTFTVTCVNTSFHTFSDTATVSVDPADPGHFDPNSANDSATSGTSTTAVTATADPAITAAAATSSAPSQCLPQSPPAPGCSAAPAVTIGTPQTVTVHKQLSNQSGFNPVNVSDEVTWIGAQEAPGGPNNVNPCTPSGVNQCTWANGTTCTVVPTGANPQTASLTAATTTLDFTFTVTCTVDSFFDSHNPEQIVLLFQDTLTPTDTHITDSNPANNLVAPITLPFWSRAPFTPSLSMKIDDTTFRTTR